MNCPNARNEIARLNGILALEQDRSSLVLGDKDSLAQEVSDLQVETDALRAQVASLQQINTDLTMEAQRQGENARIIEMSNNDLRANLERLSTRNDSFAGYRYGTERRAQCPACRVKQPGHAGVQNFQ
jgi:chromosome segregation ATPase